MEIRAKAKEVAAFLRGAKKILIVTHKNPDGDAIGSALALAVGLMSLGKEVENVNVDGVPEALSWLEGAFAVEKAPTPAFSPDVFVLLDCNSLDRTGFPPEIFASVPMAVIDHHPGAECGDVPQLIDPTASASGVLVFDILQALGVDVTPSIAQDIYVALHTDTGGFRFTNTDARTFHLAARLVELGAVPAHVSVMLLERENAARMKLLGLSLGTLEVSGEGRIALCEVTLAMFKATGTRDEHTDGFVNYPRSIEGVEVAILFKEKEPGVWRVALRSRGLADVSAIARKYGGGGHRNASGATLSGNLSEVKAAIVGDVTETLNAIWTR